MAMTRRQALKHAAAFGAALAWPSALLPKAIAAAERRDLYPQGGASGDPYPDRVGHWTGGLYTNPSPPDVEV
jgi:alkaline phosphatase D